MTTFQRARSEEQREKRRQAILKTVATMLDEMPVAEVSLNELSRRVGLAKSNVLRYFESREAILLELLDNAWKAWLADLEPRLSAELELTSPLEVRIGDLADVMSRSLADHRVFCDLLSAQARVLERNVSPAVAARYKRAAIGDVEALAAVVRSNLPGFGAQDARRLCAAIIIVAGAAWSHAQPSEAMLTAYAEDSTLEALRLDFTDTMRDLIGVLAAGVAARPAGEISSRGRKSGR